MKKLASTLLAATIAFGGFGVSNLTPAHASTVKTPVTKPVLKPTPAKTSMIKPLSMVGSIKTISQTFTASQLKAKITSATITNSIVQHVNVLVAGGIGATSIRTFGAGAVLAISSYELAQMMDLGTSSEISTMKSYLNAIKKNQAKSITVYQKYRYSYESGSGTLWCPYGPAKLKLNYTSSGFM